MEWKHLMAFAVAMLLVSPVAFATLGSNSGPGNSNRLALSAATGVVVAADSSDDDGTADQGSGDADVSATNCSTRETIKVKCDGTQAAREWRGANGCKYECATGDDLARAISITEAASAGPAGSTSSDGSVQISLVADPQEASVGSTVKAAGTIYYGDSSPSASAVPAEKKFKIELKMTGMDGSLSNRGSGQIRFESSDGGTQNRGRGSDDIISSTVRAIRASIFGSTDDSLDDGTMQGDRNIEDESSDDSRSGIGSSSSGGVVTAVETNSGSASQERTEYTTLKSGEKKSVVAYFKARTPGMKIVKMEVYESAGYDCPTATTPSVGAPCREKFRKVAEAATKVAVRGEMPPPPPGVNNTTSVASGVIALYSGWNMVSVPVMAKVQMQRVQQECGSQEFAWRLTENGYVKERTLVPGYGYWVKNTGADCKVEVKADSHTSSIAGLFSGWNLVGAPGSSVSFSGFTGNCQVTAGPWHFSHDASTTSANQYVLASSLEPGKAYWVKVSGACTMGSTEDQPPVPPQ